MAESIQPGALPDDGNEGEGGGDRLAFIDALRGYAILGVIVYHVFQYTADSIPGISRTLLQFCEQGARGVQLFFLVSAFTLSVSMRHSLAKGEFSLGRYFAKRFFRIAPMFWAGILFYAWEDKLPFSGGFRDGAGTDWHVCLSAMAFLSELKPAWINSPLPGSWSIIAEVWFYVAFPFVCARIRSGQAAALLVVGTLALRACLTGFLETHHPGFAKQSWDDYLFYWFPDHIPVFALGIALFFACGPENPKETRVLPRPGSGAIGGFMTAGGPGTALAWMACGAYLLISLVKGFKLLVPFHFHYALGLAMVIIALAKRPWPVVCNRLIVGMGKISFSAYVCHFAVLDFGIEYVLPALRRAVQNGNGLFLVFAALVIAVTAALSALLHRIIELPGQGLGRRIVGLLPKPVNGGNAISKMG